MIRKSLEWTAVVRRRKRNESTRSDNSCELDVDGGRQEDIQCLMDNMFEEGIPGIDIYGRNT